MSERGRKAKEIKGRGDRANETHGIVEKKGRKKVCVKMM